MVLHELRFHLLHPSLHVLLLRNATSNYIVHCRKDIIDEIHKICMFAYRCCHAYARRIESQLEEFRMEMERVRSRSDAILNMLNMLHSVDAN